MLKIYDVMLDAVLMMRGAVEAIDRRDGDLARQIRRAASSVVLNVGEGCGSVGRLRIARYRTAIGSARETRACLQVAEAFGYIGPMSQELEGRIDRVIGTLVRVAL